MVNSSPSVRQAGNIRGLLLFIAIQPAWKRTLCNTIQDDIDRFGLSTYDLSYGETDTMHDAPLHVTGSQPAGKSAAAAADAFIAAGVSAAKICIAVPFYTANWPNATDLYTSPGAFDPGAARLYSSLPGASGTTAPTGEQFDSDVKGAYLIGPPFESYNNVAAIQAKVDYVNAEGLGGIIIWELGQGYFPGDTPTFPLMEPFVGEASLGTVTTGKRINASHTPSTRCLPSAVPKSI
jgi:chitinase